MDSKNKYIYNQFLLGNAIRNGDQNGVIVTLIFKFPKITSSFSSTILCVYVEYSYPSLVSRMSLLHLLCSSLPRFLIIL